MALITAIITHLPPDAVARQLAYLHRLAPESRFVVCYGGPQSDFDELATEDAVFIDDPSIRGPARNQSYNAVCCALYERYVRDDPAVELVYLVEYDQLILRGDFERSLIDAASGTGAGLIAKAATRRNDTNWTHYLRFRDDEPFNAFVASISERDDPALRWGCLGTGMLFRRDALAAFCAVAGGPHAYLELLIPTVVYHLGFELADFDALGDLYHAIRWRPEFAVEEALSARAAGRTFVHPFKQVERFWSAIGTRDAGAASGPLQN